MGYTASMGIRRNRTPGRRPERRLEAQQGALESRERVREQLSHTGSGLRAAPFLSGGVIPRFR